MFFAGVFISLIVVVAAVLITQLELLVPVHAALSPYLPPEYRVKRKPRIVRHSFQPKDVPPPAPAFEPYVPEPAPPRACTLKKYSSDAVTPEAMADLTSNWTRCFVMNGIVDKWPGTENWSPDYLTEHGVGLIPPPEEDRDGIQFDGTVLDRDHAGAKALQDDCPRSDFDAVLGKNYNFADEAWDGMTYRRYILRG